MDGAGRNSAPKNGEGSGEASLVGGANWVESPFGQALSIRADGGALVGERDHGLLVSDGAFTVAAWIHPRELAQGGIVCLGGYGYTHGWVFDMPDGQGILRLETANGNRQHNGTVQSPPGTIRKDEWQHVCAVVQRGEKQARLYVNGYQVAEGTIGSADLGNPMAKLHIGRVENAQTFRGEIDEVALYKRALRPEEIEALVEPGRKYDKAPIGLMPPTEVTLNLGASGTGEQGGALVHPREGLRLSGVLKQSAFAIVRLERGKQSIEVETKGPIPIERVELRRLDQTPNQDGAKREDGSETKDPEIDDNKRAWLDAFLRFEARDPKVGVHVGLRRDCGSTLTQVGGAQVVSSGESRVFIFEGDIQNFPSPDVEPDNVNYLAGIREIGVRSEYTDGRDMPRLLIHRVEFEGPYYEQWPPESHRRIFIDRLVQESDPEYCKRVVRDFAARAFRRPVTEIEARELEIGRAHV